MVRREIRNQYEKRDPRVQAVISFIQKYDGCTMTKLSDYMENKLKVKPPMSLYASIKTTYKIVADLRNDGIIISLVNKKNRRERLLHINDENGYVQVKQILFKIRKDILRFNEPIDKINENSLSNATDLDKLLLEQYKDNFIVPYYTSTGLMLRHISKLVKNMKFSEEDNRTFMTTIMELTEEFIRQVMAHEDIKKEATYAMNKLLETKNKLSNPSSVGHQYVNSKMIDGVMQTLDSFNKIFLI